jgi:hypothetical protein
MNFDVNGESVNWEIPPYLENLVGAWAALSDVFQELQMIQSSLEWVAEGGVDEGDTIPPDPIIKGLLSRESKELDDPTTFTELLSNVRALQGLLLHEVTQQLSSLGGLPPGIDFDGS